MVRVSKSARNVLAAKTVAHLVKAGERCFVPDGGGLYLQVGGAGAASWIFRYTVNGKQRWMGLGPYVDVSLAQARELARECRALRRAGINPIAEKQRARATERRSAAKLRTFKSLADEYIEDREHKWSAKHSAQWAATLETYAHPVIGDTYVNQIGIDQIVEILKPIWVAKGETARRVRGRVEKVLDHAIDHEYRDGENPAKLGPRLKLLLNDDVVERRQTHLAALAYTDINEFITNLREKPEIARLALEFTILTAARTGEVIAATRSEISGDVWTIPAARMKNGFSHRVLLSQAALDLWNAPGLMDTSRLGRAMSVEDYFNAVRNMPTPKIGLDFGETVQEPKEGFVEDSFESASNAAETHSTNS